jgi:hypothetical protein
MEHTQRIGVPVIREYPTEWTWYPADEVDHERLEQRETEPDSKGQTATKKPPVRQSNHGAATVFAGR